MTNRFLASLGITRRFTATELRLAATGKSFRAMVTDLAAAYGRAAELEAADLEPWIAEERRRVTARLGEALEPDPGLIEILSDLASRHTLAAVSSSAASRLAVCFEAAGLDDLFPEPTRFSAEDSLPSPRSKPDPAVYAFALAQLGIAPDQALAVEDAVPGVQSAVGAGIATVGNLAFVPVEERAQRAAALREAGAVEVVGSWRELRARAQRGRP